MSKEKKLVYSEFRNKYRYSLFFYQLPNGRRVERIVPCEAAYNSGTGIRYKVGSNYYRSLTECIDKEK